MLKGSLARFVRRRGSEDYQLQTEMLDPAQGSCIFDEFLSLKANNHVEFTLQDKLKQRKCEIPEFIVKTIGGHLDNFLIGLLGVVRWWREWSQESFGMEQLQVSAVIKLYNSRLLGTPNTTTAKTTTTTTRKTCRSVEGLLLNRCSAVGCSAQGLSEQRA
ncbi:unnamed protein product, partial [Polarella glacialis]